MKNIPLPCDVGDEVYVIKKISNNDDNDFIFNSNSKFLISQKYFLISKVYIVKEIVRKLNETLFISQDNNNQVKIFELNDFGIKVFVNEEDVKKKIKMLSGDNIE